MTRTYSPKGTTLTPKPIDDSALLAMGRIIRAYAEIEDIGTLFLSALIGLNEAKSLVFFAKMPFSAKLVLMASFAAMKGPDAKHTYGLCFDNETFKSITRCRNAIAHGVYYGTTEAGEYAFRMGSSIAGIEGQKVGFDVISFSQTTLTNVASTAEQRAMELELVLGLKSSRETRLLQGLAPHSKAQPIRPPSVKHQRQRKPSPG